MDDKPNQVYQELMRFMLQHNVTCPERLWSLSKWGAELEELVYRLCGIAGYLPSEIEEEDDE